MKKLSRTSTVYRTTDRNLLVGIVAVSCFSFLTSNAVAAERVSRRARTPQNCLRPTMYNVAMEGQNGNFRRDVMMQGTGIARNGTVKKFDGARIVNRPSVTRDPADRACDSKRGEVTGASGYCLLPYFSIAADPGAGYRMGDIIHVPKLEGTIVKLPPPPGKEPAIRHPGYFIVSDTGGAIKGRGRFDFFTGTWGANDPRNAFGFQGDTEFGELNNCKKTFEVIHQNTLQWKSKMELITRTYDNVLNARPAARAGSAPQGATR